MGIRYCIAINKGSGKPCKLAAMFGSDFCNMHDPSRSEERFRRAVSATKRPRHIISKLKDQKIRDSADMAVAVKKIIEDMLKKGNLKTSTDVNVFNGLVKTAILLEQHSEVPKLIRQVEQLLEEKRELLSK